MVYFAQNHERPEVKHVVQEPTEEEKGWASASGGPFRPFLRGAWRGQHTDMRQHPTTSREPAPSDILVSPHLSLRRLQPATAFNP